MNIYLLLEFFLILLGDVFLVGMILLGDLDLAGLLNVPRAILGLIYVLFLPGYTLQALLFPRRTDLDGAERTVLAFALSGASVPLVVLLLNALPWGIRLWPVVLAMSLLVLFSSGLSLMVRRRIPRAERYDPLTGIKIRQWWATQEGTNRKVYIALAAILGVATLTAISIVALPQPADFYTEFYILGEEGRPEDYPRKAVIGEMLTVTAGINNHERQDKSYYVEVWVQDPLEATRRQQVGTFGPFELAVGETVEAPLSWGMPWAGEDQRVEFLLFMMGEEGVYRELRLWINVEE